MIETLRNLLNFPRLTTLVRNPVGGVPFPECFKQLAKLEDKSPITDKAEYFVVSGQRRNAAITSYDSPSILQTVEPIERRAVMLLSSRNRATFPASLFAQITQLNKFQLDERGTELIEEYTNQHRQRLNNLLISSIAMRLTQAALYVDGQGNLVTGPGAGINTVGEVVPIENRGRCPLNDGPDIFTSWASTNAPIAQQLANARRRMLQFRNVELTECYYSSNIHQYILQNATINALANNTAYYDKFSTGSIPNGFLGWNWHEVTTSYFLTETGSLVDIWPADLIVLTPKPNKNWFRHFVGSSIIPSTAISRNYFPGVQQAMDATRMDPGMYEYAQMLSDPVTFEFYYGMTWMPLLTAPDHILQADVGP